MRPHPNAAPPPLPPMNDNIPTAALSPPSNHNRLRSQDDMDIPFGVGDPDSDTGNLLPTRSRRHRVRVQGRLAVVRSVSTANLRPGQAGSGGAGSTPNLGTPVLTPRFGPSSGASSPATPRFENMLAGRTGRGPARRRRSLDGSCSSDDDEAEVVVRDRQLRGYGIGGVGNIRRPTEVIYGSTRSSDATPLSGSPEKRWWNVRDILGRMGDRKGKTRAA